MTGYHMAPEGTMRRMSHNDEDMKTGSSSEQLAESKKTEEK